MALTSTIYNLEIDLSDVDRGVYDHLDLRLAMHPSESPEYMTTRVLAYCLEYTAGIEFTRGLSDGDEPAIVVRDLTGRVTAWIEVGFPDAERLHRAAKLAERVAVYTYRDVRNALNQFRGKKIHRAAEIPIYAFGTGFVQQVAAAFERRTHMMMSVTERHVYLDVEDRAFSTDVVEYRAV